MTPSVFHGHGYPWTSGMKIHPNRESLFKNRRLQITWLARRKFPQTITEGALSVVENKGPTLLWILNNKYLTILFYHSNWTRKILDSLHKTAVYGRLNTIEVEGWKKETHSNQHSYAFSLWWSRLFFKSWWSTNFSVRQKAFGSIPSPSSYQSLALAFFLDSRLKSEKSLGTSTILFWQYFLSANFSITAFLKAFILSLWLDFRLFEQENVLFSLK